MSHSILLSDMLDEPELYKDPTVIVPYIAWERRLTLLAGREKLGKSTLMAHASVSITKGTPFLGQDVSPGRVLWISFEEPREDIGRRFLRLGGDPTKLHLLIKPNKLYKEVEEDCEEWRERGEGFSLLVWDSLTRIATHIHPKEIKPNDSTAWSAIMEPLLDITHEYASSSLLHHAKKNDGRYRDSGSIGGIPDVVIEMLRKPGNDRLLDRWGRFGMSQELITLDGDEFRVIATGPLEDRIKDFIGKNPGCSWGELRDGVSGSSSEIGKVRDRLEEDGAIINQGEGKAHAYHLFSFSLPKTP